MFYYLNTSMMKYFIWMLFALSMSSCVMTQTIVDAPSSVNMPKNAMFISQSGTESNLMQTLIDLKNNEMVVMTYNYADLINVTRTGIFLNPEDYKQFKIIGTDAPFKKEVEEEKVKPLEEDK